MVAVAEKTYLGKLLENGEELIFKGELELQRKGLNYSQTEWLSPIQYCEKFEIKNVEIIANWINTGKIPTQNIRILKELNNLKLIKAVPYK